MSDGWQPIETIPKIHEGQIMVAGPEGVEIVEWDEDQNLWCSTLGGSMYSLYSDKYADEWTHWMPLPNPPRPS